MKYVIWNVQYKIWKSSGVKKSVELLGRRNSDQNAMISVWSRRKRNRYTAEYGSKLQACTSSSMLRACLITKSPCYKKQPNYFDISSFPVDWECLKIRCGISENVVPSSLILNCHFSPWRLEIDEKTELWGIWCQHNTVPMHFFKNKMYLYFDVIQIFENKIVSTLVLGLVCSFSPVHGTNHSS